MPTTYTTRAYLAKISDTDDDWGSEQRPVFDVLDRLVAWDDRTFFVAPGFSQANVYPQGVPAQANRRWFNTIQAAIDAAELSAEKAQVLVLPGTYAECITIRRSISVRGLFGCAPFFYPGPQSIIRGDGSTKALVTFQMTNGEPQWASMHGMQLENANADPGATEVTSQPYALWIKDKEVLDSYGGLNFYGFSDCVFRMQTWGVDSKWQKGVDIDCYGDVFFQNCQFTGLNYGGGNNNGYIRRLIDMAGPGSSNRLVVRLDACKFAQDEVAGSPPQQRSIYQGNYSQVYVHRSTFSQLSTAAREQYGALGMVSAGFPGDPTDNTDLVNVFGFNAVMT